MSWNPTAASDQAACRSRRRRVISLSQLPPSNSTAALSPLMQQGNLIARKVHVGLNMGVVTLFLWQAVTGMQIVNKIWENRPV